MYVDDIPTKYDNMSISASMNDLHSYTRIHLYIYSKYVYINHPYRNLIVLMGAIYRYNKIHTTNIIIIAMTKMLI